jgi:hypothetical protein
LLHPHQGRLRPIRRTERDQKEPLFHNIKVAMDGVPLRSSMAAAAAEQGEIAAMRLVLQTPVIS